MTYKAFAFVGSSKFGSNSMLNLPIYLLGSSYYLHTRIAGKQFKRSLRTSYKREAIMRAIALLNTMLKKDLPAKYELDMARGILKADGSEDHTRLMQAMEAMKALHTGQPVQPPAMAPIEPADDPTALKLGELLEKMLLLRTLATATVKAYKNVNKELSKFLNNPPITQITQSDITRFQEHLAKKGNVPRTIDTKISNIGALLNFAKVQGYTRKDNPAANRSLMSKKQKLQDGFATFEKEELDLLFRSEFYKEQQTKSPDYANTVVLALMTGCRISEITNLKRDQLKTSPQGIPYMVIRDSKTMAGIREVPLHPFIVQHIAPFIKNKSDKLFKYVEVDGKGSGNAVGKMFSRNLQAAGVKRKKLVFHSLRKYVNNQLMRNKVSLENRCQFIGHELEHVNVATYTTNLNIDELAATVFPTLEEIFEIVKSAADPMNGINLGNLIDEDTLI